jgi:hypothetical protein
MEIEVITRADLNDFRMKLLDDISKLIQPSPTKLVKPWLKNSEVRKLLNISSNTIQRLRVSGKLRSSKVGGIHYYRFEDIEKLLNNHAA